MLWGEPPRRRKLILRDVAIAIGLLLFVYVVYVLARL